MVKIRNTAFPSYTSGWFEDVWCVAMEFLPELESPGCSYPPSLPGGTLGDATECLESDDGGSFFFFRWMKAGLTIQILVIFFNIIGFLTVRHVQPEPHVWCETPSMKNEGFHRNKTGFAVCNQHGFDMDWSKNRVYPKQFWWDTWWSESSSRGDLVDGVWGYLFDGEPTTAITMVQFSPF